jgi:hypothetical protein
MLAQHPSLVLLVADGQEAYLKYTTSAGLRTAESVVRA